jgi:hypothetical protein
MNEFLTYLVGAAGCKRFAAALFFSLIGLLIRLTGKKENACFLGQAHTGSEWRKFFFIHLKMTSNTLLVVYVFLRFPLAFVSPEMVEVIPEEFIFLFAAITGFSYDRLTALLKAASNRFFKNNTSDNGKDS